MTLNSWEAPSHKRLCDIVQKHCEDKGMVVLRNYEYDVKGEVGEVDVLAADKYGFIFYEIKSTHMPRKYAKATEQYRRFKRTHDLRFMGESIRGIYVTPTRVRRLH